MGRLETIRANKEGRRLVSIANRVFIGEGTIIGQKDNPSWGDELGTLPTFIGHECSIGNFCSISEGVYLSDRVKIGNNVVIRSGVRIAEDSVIGHGTVFEGDADIGRDTLIHSQCHITKGAKIGSQVFIAPYFVGANDPLCMRRKFMSGQPEFVPEGYEIGDGARIGIGAIVLPRVKIGTNAFVAAGSVVTKDVLPNSLVMGVPARFVRFLRSEECVVKGILIADALE
jgi:acetyltransferase-like isoleucine patch superfamily enzyme